MFTSFHRISAASLLLLATALPSQAETLRWLTQTQSHNAQYPVEMAAIEAIGATGVTVERNEFQILGLNLADSLRLVGSGAFQLGTTQVAPPRKTILSSKAST
ncbi:hypothetical protein [Roseobacter sp. TSBP12]|uniref:hypothetical protein n=1 Tax=Roseobacter sp. TSBP12 TaxID=1236613 RepID=UPI001D00D8AE|nr:hypothetical protein [Roseobacter sp. TSBP12]